MFHFSDPVRYNLELPFISDTTSLLLENVEAHLSQLQAKLSIYLQTLILQGETALEGIESFSSSIQYVISLLPDSI